MKTRNPIAKVVHKLRPQVVLDKRQKAKLKEALDSVKETIKRREEE